MTRRASSYPVPAAGQTADSRCRPLLAWSALLFALLAHLPAGAAEPPSPRVHTHRLTVTLDPPRHRIQVSDEMRVEVPSGTDHLAFTLRASLHVTRLGASGRDAPLPFQVRPDEPAPGLQTILVPAGDSRDGRLELQWQYDGVIDDPPRERQHLRFVAPSETTGHIGPEGVYLSGETGWYPDLPGSLARFTVGLTVPDGWRSVTHGRRTPAAGAPGAPPGFVMEHWEAEVPTEALTVVANRFSTSSRRWHEVEVSTYLFPEDAGLASEYLDAAVRYLELYTRLLGPYPFPKFAVVENFFPSGLGMPSFTLLGSGVIKRHYVQPYALGHEIVHSWIGNWVLNRPEDGNWVEGLTTYLANYYYDEWQGREAEAREQRRLMLLGYGVYVTPETDYPVAQFRRKTDQKDNAIGYQKAAMIFHMLRREVGEEVFWSALRQLVSARGGRYTTWHHLERLFSAAAGRDLGWFFDQWVDRPGAPSLAVREAQGQRRKGGATLRLRLQQADPPYRLQVPVRIETDRGERRLSVLVEERDRVVELPLDAEPRRVQLDPDFEVFREIDRAEIPPMLNLFVTDARRTVVLGRSPEDPEAERDPYRSVATRLRRQAGDHQAAVAVIDGEAASSEEDAAWPDGSVLVLAGLDHPAGRRIEQICGARLKLDPEGVEIDGGRYEGRDVAVLVSCRRPDQPRSVVTLFGGVTDEAAAHASRLLFFYGWQSYLVFRNGQVVARGDFPAVPAETEKEVSSAR